MISGKMYRFRPKTDLLDPRYLEAYLNAPTTQLAIDGMKTGISDSGLNLTHERFMQLPVPLAPLEEQHRIVEGIETNFARLDATLSSLEESKVKLQEFRGSLVNSVFPTSLPEDFSLCEPSALEAAPPRETSIKWRPLETLVREPLRNGLTTRSAGKHVGIRTLTLTAVTLGDFSAQNTKHTAVTKEEAENLWLEPGDILIERSNTRELVGTSALYRGPTRFAIFPDMVIRVRVSSELLPEYLHYFLHSSPVRKYFQRSARGVAGNMPKIHQGTIRRLPVPFAPLATQRQVAGYLDATLLRAATTEGILKRQMSRCTSLRASILGSAFGGLWAPPARTASTLRRSSKGLDPRDPSQSTHRVNETNTIA